MTLFVPAEIPMVPSPVPLLHDDATDRYHSPRHRTKLHCIHKTVKSCTVHCVGRQWQ